MKAALAFLVAAPLLQPADAVKQSIRDGRSNRDLVTVSYGNYEAGDENSFERSSFSVGRQFVRKGGNKKDKGGDDDDDDDGAGGVPAPTPHPPEIPDGCTARASQLYDNIDLNAENAVSPYNGVPFGSGIARVEIIFDNCGGLATPWIACINADFGNFIPEILQINRAPIYQNGPGEINFSDLLSGSNADGCVPISEALYLELVQNPEVFYISALPVGPGLQFLEIRGQLIQGFKQVPIDNAMSVLPFTSVPFATGTASMTFEQEGQIACFDATVVGLDPQVARLYYGQPGMNGPVVFDFSSLKTGPGRFFGCIPIEQLGPNINVQVVCEVLADGYLYYFQFHQSTTEPGFLTTVRAQIPPVVPL